MHLPLHNNNNSNISSNANNVNDRLLLYYISWSFTTFFSSFFFFLPLLLLRLVVHASSQVQSALRLKLHDFGCNIFSKTGIQIVYRFARMLKMLIASGGAMVLSGFKCVYTCCASNLARFVMPQMNALKTIRVQRRGVDKRGQPFELLQFSLFCFTLCSNWHDQVPKMVKATQTARYRCRNYPTRNGRDTWEVNSCISTNLSTWKAGISQSMVALKYLKYKSTFENRLQRAIDPQLQLIGFKICNRPLHHKHSSTTWSRWYLLTHMKPTTYGRFWYSDIDLATRICWQHKLTEKVLVDVTPYKQINKSKNKSCETQDVQFN